MTDTILFDLDGTLFDIKKLFNQFIKPELSKVLNVPYVDFEQVNDGYWQLQQHSHVFNVDDYLAYLVYNYRIPAEELKPTFDKVEHYQNCIYEDVMPTLTYFQNKNWKLGIFSEGDLDFQRHKLTASGLTTWFTPELIFITLQKTEDAFIKTLPASIVVEDKTRIIQALATAPHLQTVWLNRDGLPLPPGMPEPDSSQKTIHTLLDLKTLFP